MHEVLRVIDERVRSGSKPGQRSDAYRLALSIEGGGMRGTVSAGMAIALFELGGPDGGRLAIIAPDALIPALAEAVPAAVPGDRPESLDAAAALLTVSQAKGLEFDRVIVTDPAGLLSQSQNGGHDLYVAITRATHRLTVLYDGELPASLRSLRA